jgi:hypothetical protein
MRRGPFITKRIIIKRSCSGKPQASTVADSGGPEHCLIVSHIQSDSFQNPTRVHEAEPVDGRGWYLKRSSLVNENPSPAKKSFDAFQFMNIQIVASINRP